MTLLDLYGLVCVVSMMVFYALESRHRHWTLAFAVGCAFSSSYGFLQGAWPFGIAEGIWTFVALKKWHSLGR